MGKTESYKKQLSIGESFKKASKEEDEDNELKSRVKNSEIDLIRGLDHHNVTADLLPCLVNWLKSHFSGEDSYKVVDSVSISKTKGRYIAQHGIAKTYREETVEKAINCDGFSIGFDESEMNKNTVLEIILVLATKGVGIEMRHYRTVSLEGGDAETIVNAIKDELEGDNIAGRKS